MAHAKADDAVLRPDGGVRFRRRRCSTRRDQVRRAGYTKADAYSPFPIHGLAEALGFQERHVAPIVLGAGITGALAGYGLEYWTQVIDFPMNIGGRPVPLVGVVHSAGVRDDDSLRGVLRRHRHARAERTAAAVSPGLQRGAVRARQPGRILPRHRGDRPEVRCRRHAAVPVEPASARGGAS